MLTIDHSAPSGWPVNGLKAWSPNCSNWVMICGSLETNTSTTLQRRAPKLYLSITSSRVSTPSAPIPCYAGTMFSWTQRWKTSILAPSTINGPGSHPLHRLDAPIRSTRRK